MRWNMHWADLVNGKKQQQRMSDVWIFRCATCMVAPLSFCFACAKSLESNNSMLYDFNVRNIRHWQVSTTRHSFRFISYQHRQIVTNGWIRPTNAILSRLECIVNWAKNTNLSWQHRCHCRRWAIVISTFNSIDFVFLILKINPAKYFFHFTKIQSTKNRQNVHK